MSIFTFLRSKLKKIWPILVFLGVYLVIFYQVFLRGLIPFPCDLLVSWFFPYNSGGWQGFSPWITHKEFIAADVIRQLYPWRVLSIDLFKKGEWPLWNPYAFSGYPLLANLQSSVFYPFNFFFFSLSNIDAWIVYIMIQPILAFIFMYQLSRSFDLSKISATLSGISFAFLGFFLVWFEWGVIGHSGLWLPACLWAINEGFKKKRTFLFLPLFLSLSLLAGHLQTTVYVFLVSLLFFLWKVSQQEKKRTFLFKGIVFFLFPFFLTSMQILPSFELFSLSARDLASSKEIFEKFILPGKHLVTIFAPNFFGNPATKNFWGKDYGEFMAYFGVVTLVFSAYSLCLLKKKEVRFFWILSFLALAFATSPLAKILLFSRLPVLSTGIPARTLFIFGFCQTLLSGFGLELLLRRREVKNQPIFTLFFFYFLLWASVFFIKKNNPVNANVALRNLVVPTVSFLVVSFLILASQKLAVFKKTILLGVFIPLSLELAIFTNKFLPLASKSYVFPSHPLISFLGQKTKEDFARVYGYDTARLDANLPTFWRLYFPEGYDPLYPRRYGELIESSKKGKLVTKIPRSDAFFENTLPPQESLAQKRLFDILGIKYVLDKDDNPKKSWEPQPWRFPEERFTLVWQKGKWKVYENKDALPRAFLVGDYVVEKEKEKIIEKLFAHDFNPKEKLVLEEEPSDFKVDRNATGSAKIVSYAPNEVAIKTQTSKNMLLFLSDNFYPGWKALLDGKEAKILRANYTFRAVAIPSGEHSTIFSYEPSSFKAGLAISVASVAGYLLLCLKKRF